MNQYPSVGGNSFTYDDNGCLTDDGVWDFGYDTENRLVSADDGTTSASYIYDPTGRQTQKEVNSTKTRYIHAGIRIIAEYDGSDTFVKRYVHGPGLDEVLLEIDSSNDVTYLHHDRLGSIIATTDDTGAVIDTFAYSPWGESGSMSGTTFGFTGQRYDAETGLYFYKNRHYSPETGRFLQPDSIGYGDGLNMYQYGYNNPNSFTDPLGTFTSGPIEWWDAGSFFSTLNSIKEYTDKTTPGVEQGIAYLYNHVAHPILEPIGRFVGEGPHMERDFSWVTGAVTWVPFTGHNNVDEATDVFVYHPQVSSGPGWNTSQSYRNDFVQAAKYHVRLWDINKSGQISVYDPNLGVRTFSSNAVKWAVNLFSSGANFPDAPGGIANWLLARELIATGIFNDRPDAHDIPSKPVPKRLPFGGASMEDSEGTPTGK